MLISTFRASGARRRVAEILTGILFTSLALGSAISSEPEQEPRPVLKLDQVRILVDDLPRARRFYIEVLGLEIGFENRVYVQLESDSGVSIGLFGREAMADAIGTEASTGDRSDRSVLIFRVEDVDAAAAELVERGAQQVSPPTDRPLWGLRTAHFNDPEGNLIELIHRLDPS